MIVVLVILVCLVVYLYIQSYYKSSYYKITHNSFIEVYLDKGKMGEYLIYEGLKPFEKEGNKFLFNIYLPSDDDKTTELDLIMISKKGIIVFESKNYSGWIFGDEKSKMWMQTLPTGKGKSYKSQFFNPIFQNEGHIKYLKKLVGDTIPIFSIITFSERCTLKKVPENTKYTKVIKRNIVYSTVKEINENNDDTLTQDKVTEVFHNLFMYSQTNDKMKNDHIMKIKENHF